MLSRVKELEQKNGHLEKMYADVQLEAHAVKESLAKKFWTFDCLLAYTRMDRATPRREMSTLVRSVLANWHVTHA